MPWLFALIKELEQPVFALDGEDLLTGWQPQEIDEARLFGGYLRWVLARAGR